MARLTLTNDRDSHRYILARDKKAGFGDGDTVECDGVFLAVHRKRRHPIPNFVRLPNGDFVACAGTLIYGNKRGSEALERIYSEFDGDIGKIRGNALGSYFVAIKKGPTLSAFNEKYESLFTYWWRHGNDWIISNSLAAVAEAAYRKTKELPINAFALIEDSFHITAIGQETIFEGISKLSGMERVSVDVKTGSMQLIPIPYTRALTDETERTEDRMAERFAERLRGKLESVHAAFGDDIGIMATGGMDNRILLAGLLAVGAKPTLVHSVGMQSLADLAIVKGYADKFGLELREMAWKARHLAAADYYDKLYDRNGFLGTAGICLEFYDGYESGPMGERSLTFTGYYGELIRKCGALDLSLAWQKRFSRPTFSTDAFVDFYLAVLDATVRPASCIDYGAFRRHVTEKIESYASRYGVQKQDGVFRAIDFQLVYDPYVRGGHPTWGNVINHSTCCMYPLNADDLHEMAFEVPFAWRKNDRFAVRVINHLFPAIFEVPFHCHCRDMVLDRKRLEIRQPAGSQFLDSTAHRLQESRAGQAMFEVLRRTKVGHLIRRMQKDLQREERGQHVDPDKQLAGAAAGELPEFRRMVREEQEAVNLRIVDPDAYTGDLFSLAKYWKMLHGIRRVREAATAE